MTAEHTPDGLLSIYETLYHHYGPQHWWPAEEPFEVIVGAILTQSTAWLNVEKAISNLKRAALLNPGGLHSLPLSELAELIRPSGYFNQKAKKLKVFVEHLVVAHDADLTKLFALDLPALRKELLGLYGIGPETADSIILYAAGKPTFVIDAYTKRIFSRLGHVSPAARYDDLQGLFMSRLPHEVPLFNEYHGLLVRHAKYVCCKRPRCATCVLAERCRYGREAREGPP